MDMSNFRPEIHIAHQTRRDKLRIHNHVVSNPPNHHLGLYNSNNNMNFSYDPSEFCSTTDSFDYPPDAVNMNRDPQSYFITPTTTATTTTTDNRWVSTNRTPNFVSNIGSDNPVLSALDAKSYDQGYEEFHSPSSNNQNHRPGEISSPFYHNALQELVSTSGVRSFAPTGSSNQKGSEGTSNGPWMVNSGELLLLPSYGDQSGLRCSDDSIHRPVTAHHWKDELDHFASSGKDNSHTQALSLSLSSVQSPNIQDFIIPNLSSGCKISENARQEMMGTRALSTHRNPGPLGPFTGYATILRSSNFLMPAQILLEELCCVSGPKKDGIYGGIGRVLEEVGVFGEGVISNGEQHGMIAGDSGRWMDRYRPEKFQKKAKLLYMQDEVCKRYEHYHQQMQMVVSSFESVAGLSAATPYVPFALKLVSKNFRCLKNAITDQLRSIRNGLSEELCNGNDASGSMMLKFFDQSLQKSKGVSDNVLEGQHIWRPQRGLPERAVSVLRAWLFDHFLHPYPTDTDKHMLAIQTGLTRNQVSNWFINARVRVWKPMVEEIHVLETKAVSNDTCSDGRTTATTADRDRQANKNTNKMSDDNYSSLVDPPEQASDRLTSACRINREKRSRIEYRRVPMSVIDGSLTGFVPSHQTVSLTLGLRQSAENGQRPDYRGRVIRDSVG